MATAMIASPPTDKIHDAVTEAFRHCQPDLSPCDRAEAINRNARSIRWSLAGREVVSVHHSFGRVGGGGGLPVFKARFLLDDGTEKTFGIVI